MDDRQTPVVRGEGTDSLPRPEAEPSAADKWLARKMNPRAWAKHDEWLRCAERNRQDISLPEDMRRIYVRMCERDARAAVAESLAIANSIAAIPLEWLDDYRAALSAAGTTGPSCVPGETNK